MAGWIKLYRKIKDCYFWPEIEQRKFTHLEAWIDLLLTANHKPKNIIIDLQNVNVDRGQLLTSEVKLSIRWKWSRNKVRRFIRELETDGMLKKKSTTKYTVLTIDKYDFYQGDDTTNETALGTALETAKKQQTEHKQECKESKERKNEKKVLNNYSDFVKMTSVEYQKLIDKFGETKAKDWIERLNLYKGSTGKKYTSDYLTILNWSKKEETKKSKDIPKAYQSAHSTLTEDDTL